MLGNYTVLGNAILHSRKLFSCNIEPRIVDIQAPNQLMLSTLLSSLSLTQHDTRSDSAHSNAEVDCEGGGIVTAVGCSKSCIEVAFKGVIIAFNGKLSSATEGRRGDRPTVNSGLYEAAFRPVEYIQ